MSPAWQPTKSLRVRVHSSVETAESRCSLILWAGTPIILFASSKGNDAILNSIGAIRSDRLGNEEDGFNKRLPKEGRSHAHQRNKLKGEVHKHRGSR